MTADTESDLNRCLFLSPLLSFCMDSSLLLSYTIRILSDRSRIDRRGHFGARLWGVGGDVETLAAFYFALHLD
jgi:hypothetical protein